MAAQSPGRPAPLAGRVVLVVDDDADIRRMTATVLRAAGATVELAGSGAEASRKLSRSRYDAVLLDWHLDDMSADAFLVAAETAHAGVGARVAVMTGDLIRRGEPHEAERRGHVLLRKPFAPKELVAVIARVSGASPHDG
jgi:DNA-binding response OmpR family regulator